MDASITIGILSIIMGFVTFLISEKHSKQNKWQNAKDKILLDLSKSLGEGNIPPPSIINSIIRSELRLQNQRNFNAITIEEIIDDLLKQIVTDPFLDSEKRKKFLSDAEWIKQETIKETSIQSVTESELPYPLDEPFLDRSELYALLSGITTSIIAAISLTSVNKITDLFKILSNQNMGDYIFPVLSVIVTVVVSIIYLFVMRGKKKKTSVKRTI